MATCRGRRKRPAHQLALGVTTCDKGLGGMGGGESDGGTGTRIRGTLLTWMAEKTTPVFVIATANEIRGLPPEMTRSGRFDSVFFVDLPQPEEREAIWRIHLGKVHQLDKLSDKDIVELSELSKGFSGAEIEQAVHDTMYEVNEPGKDLDVGFDDLAASLSDMVPLSKARAADLRGFMQWAKENARHASLSPKAFHSISSDNEARYGNVIGLGDEEGSIQL